jgi:hypothetical protein
MQESNSQFAFRNWQYIPYPREESPPEADQPSAQKTADKLAENLRFQIDLS